jgi:hypothetical protein
MHSIWSLNGCDNEDEEEGSEGKKKEEVIIRRGKKGEVDEVHIQ